MPQAYDLEQMDAELHERRVLASQSEYLAALLRSARRTEALLTRIAEAVEAANVAPAVEAPTTAPTKRKTRKTTAKG